LKVLVGINVTGRPALQRLRRFLADGLADFAELMLDDYLHLDPSCVARELRGCPVAFHIMASRFLDRDEDELAVMASRIHRWIEALGPLYVSDHLACHETCDGRLLPQVVEPDYSDATLVRRAALWRDLLKHELLLENFPSASEAGRGQVRWFEAFLREPGLGILFDASNAMVAEGNGGDSARSWVDSHMVIRACHVSGYRPSESFRSFIVDSHDCRVSEQSWTLLTEIAAGGRLPPTLVVERDDNLEDASWAEDLQRARQLAAGASCP
jgi:uncharacterized protein